MQIVTNTYERLTLRLRHTMLAGTAWGCGAILTCGIWNKWVTLDQEALWAMSATALAAFCTAIYLLRPAILDFDRAANRFRWVRPGLFGSTRDEVSLDSIRRVPYRQHRFRRRQGAPRRGGDPIPGRAHAAHVLDRRFERLSAHRRPDSQLARALEAGRGKHPDLDMYGGVSYCGTGSRAGSQSCRCHGQ